MSSPYLRMDTFRPNQPTACGDTRGCFHGVGQRPIIQNATPSEVPSYLSNANASCGKPACLAAPSSRLWHLERSNLNCCEGLSRCSG
eukprot:2274616-Amphidinium_carterae.2